MELDRFGVTERSTNQTTRFFPKKIEKNQKSQTLKKKKNVFFETTKFVLFEIFKFNDKLKMRPLNATLYIDF